jgi:hypothetical protein
MGVLESVLLLTALLVGATGTWSPCGFSMIETIGPTGHTGGRRTTLAACATFLPGALAGGILTFGGLAAIGGAIHGTDQRLAYLLAAAIAIGAAVLEARGAALVPQIRRQLPEHWRRTMPMPVAAALYGGLLGLGFTTFVLTFGVWAVAAISFAVGDPTIGVGIGLAFGVGRAVPIVALAPFAGTAAGARVTELMADRPGLYRGLRIGDALALALAAAALAGSQNAFAVQTAVKHAADPGSGHGLVFQRADRTGVLRRGGETTMLPGKDPAIGGPYIAVRAGGGIDVLDGETLAPLTHLQADGANSVAISGRWVAWRSHRRKHDEIRARKIDDLLSPNKAKTIARAGGGERFGPPSVDGAKVAFASASRSRNAIVRKGLRSGRGHPVVSSRFASLHSPTIGHDHMLFVKATRKRQYLVLKRFGGGARNLHSRSRRSGTLWSTALDAERAYVTLIKGRNSFRILRASR